jgi:pyrimidine operon attenuation protein/uracil phosphoribosyltransferase
MTGRQIMTADEIRRATIRISHEIVEKQAGTATEPPRGEGARDRIRREGATLARRRREAERAHLRVRERASPGATTSSGRQARQP